MLSPGILAIKSLCHEFFPLDKAISEIWYYALLACIAYGMEIVALKTLSLNGLGLDIYSDSAIVPFESFSSLRVVSLPANFSFCSASLTFFHS